MWPPWGKSPGRSITRTPSSNFSFSSFKDIPLLILEEKQQQEEPQTKKPSIFHRVRVAKSVLRSWKSCPIQRQLLLNLVPSPNPNVSPSLISLPGTETHIVIYFTSLRIVRRTLEDCRTARTILRGFRVKIDERDLSMDAGFLEELRQILGVKNKDHLALPRVFIGGRYIGGAEEIRQLHEIGELKKIVQGFPCVDPGVCEYCGGYRFVLCEHCNGSRKCYMEKGRGFRTCLVCNENGLIRCPSCTTTTITSTAPPSDHDPNLSQEALEN